MINRTKVKMRGYVPPNSHRKLSKIEDLVHSGYKCFDCGNACLVENGIIVAHENNRNKICWASGRPKPVISSNPSRRGPHKKRKK